MRSSRPWTFRSRGLRRTSRSTGENDAPVANDDSFTTAEDSAFTTAAPGVLFNDTDIDGNPLTAVLVLGPTKGTLTLNAVGNVTQSGVISGTGTSVVKNGAGRIDAWDQGVACFDPAPVVPVDTTAAGDAFNLANTLPNVFYMLAAGGILNAVLIPALTREAGRTFPGDRNSSRYQT